MRPDELKIPPQPQPLFADAASVEVPLDKFYLDWPSVKRYLSIFPSHIDVENDFFWARTFLAQHNCAQGTFGNYRGFVERLLLWSWICAGKSVLHLTRDEYQCFVSFITSPPGSWVGDVPRQRFISLEGVWVVNDEWRPMCNKLGAEKKTGKLDFLSYMPSIGSVGQAISICSAFYNFLRMEGVSYVNPVTGKRLQGCRTRRHSYYPVSRVLTADQWGFVISVAERMACKSYKHERTLFIVAAMYFLYLRTSDLLINNSGRCLSMGAFVQIDSEWWLDLDSSDSFPSKISVNPDFLPYLVRYRKSRGLTPLPTPNEPIPLLETVHGRPGLRARQVRSDVKEVLTQAHLEMKIAGRSDAECAALLSASSAWLRESGAKSAAPCRARRFAR